MELRDNFNSELEIEDYIKKQNKRELDYLTIKTFNKWNDVEKELKLKFKIKNNLIDLLHKNKDAIIEYVKKSNNITTLMMVDYYLNKEEVMNIGRLKNSDNLNTFFNNIIKNKKNGSIKHFYIDLKDCKEKDFIDLIPIKEEYFRFSGVKDSVVKDSQSFKFVLGSYYLSINLNIQVNQPDYFSDSFLYVSKTITVEKLLDISNVKVI